MTTAKPVETVPCSVIELLDRVDRREPGKITLGSVVEELESVGFGPLMLVPSLLGIVVGAIPMLNTVCAILIILVAGQVLFGHTHPWLPERLRRVTLSHSKFKSGVNAMRPALKFIERHAHPRLVFLTTGAAQPVVAFLCILLGVAIIIMDLLPFAAAIPSAAIMLMALGLTLRDGLFMVLAGVMIVAGFWVML